MRYCSGTSRFKIADEGENDAAQPRSARISQLLHQRKPKRQRFGEPFSAFGASSARGWTSTIGFWIDEDVLAVGPTEENIRRAPGRIQICVAYP